MLAICAITCDGDTLAVGFAKGKKAFNISRIVMIKLFSP